MMLRRICIGALAVVGCLGMLDLMAQEEGPRGGGPRAEQGGQGGPPRFGRGPMGGPVAIDVYPGNTGDPSIVPAKGNAPFASSN